MINMNNRVTPINRQAGVVLIVSMVMLLLLTLIGLSGSRVTSLEEKMAGNARDQNTAFQAAESTLLAAEQYVLAVSNTVLTYNGTRGLLDFDPADPEPDYFSSNTWTAANSAPTLANSGLNFGIRDPRYIVKRIDQNPGTGAGPVTIFKITARAEGSNPGTQVILQEIFVRTN
jgi:type IV pilus assembly protein PilX